MTMPLLKALLAVLSLAAAAPLPQYEPNPELQASEILSPQQLRGEDHAVREIVLNDGFLNQYVVETPFGDFDAEGNRQLVRRRRMPWRAWLREQCPPAPSAWKVVMNSGSMMAR